MNVNIDIAFSRALMREATKTVREFFPRISVQKDAWVHKSFRDSWEFHGPDKFYWYGTADNAYHARYQGWMAWLRHKGINL